MIEPRVVYHDADLLVIDKPSGLATTSPDGSDCLAAWARAHDPAAERMHPSSRLDAEVTGLVTFARTSRAIAQLSAARAASAYRRFYLGLAERTPAPAAGDWRAPIARDPKDPRRRVVAAGGSSAWSRYRTLAELPQLALLLLQPETGRTHQLRVHAAHAGAPLWGDKHYGGRLRAVLADGRVHAARRVMLHCAQLILPGVASLEPITVQAPPPPDLRAFFAALGGDEARLDPLGWS
jgi:23S rRNA pseudouridine1911/1915/1917 synthase